MRLFRMIIFILAASLTATTLFKYSGPVSGLLFSDDGLVPRIESLIDAGSSADGSSPETGTLALDSADSDSAASGDGGDEDDVSVDDDAASSGDEIGDGDGESSDDGSGDDDGESSDDASGDGDGESSDDASASEDGGTSEIDISLRYCRSQLSEEEKLVYDMLAASALAEDPTERGEEITISLDPSGEEFTAMFHKVYNAIMFDHPELFWLSMSNSAFQYSYHKSLLNSSSYVVSFALAEAFEDRDDKMRALESAADDLLSDIDLSAPNEEVALAIHDKLISLASYDKDVAASSEKDYAHTAYGALVANSSGESNMAVCDGYSYAYEYLLQKAGILCTVISGRAGDTEETAGNHSWNLVNLDGDWYEVDATWDDISVEELNSDSDYSEIADEALSSEWYMDLLTHYLFNVTTEEMSCFEPDESYRYSNDRGWVSFLGSSVHIRHTAEESATTGDYMTPIAPVAEGTQYSYGELRE